MKPGKSVRCAIYTRVSTEQGLDQEFNSLDAQREASEAYIKSQAHEGWICLKQAYDDGGYSGGSMERPALKVLLDDVKAKKLDVIVVYKVDRLTRSLADFAKLVELFDANGVSFVSVTQSFNTTSSMGRLTLNVLLSFAQFEREVTGERIRDKFAASKKKGMWMGGPVPLGYRLEKRKLLVDPPEAQKVRQIFQLYLELKSLPKLAMKLAELGIMSRLKPYGEGKTIGGHTYRTGALSHLLANRIYIGEVRHHKQHFPGEHESILGKDLFESVQAELATRLNRKNRTTHSSDTILKGLIFDSNGNRMIPTHANKAGVRYRYYQSWVLAQGQKDKAGVVSRVPAQDIEQAVLNALGERFPNQTAVIKDDEAKIKLLERIDRIDVLQNVLNITLIATGTEAETESGSDTNLGQSIGDSKLTVPWSKPSMHRKQQITEQFETPPYQRPMRSETRSRLLKGIAQGRIWLDSLTSSQSENIQSIAKRQSLSEKTVRSTLSLAVLSPDIVDATIEGRLPRGLTVTQTSDLSADWHEQRIALGLA
ncbi:MAG: recombinase family protein [Pseudomonadota bacterium]|nr:recombinase family protein [Pseudomonadota bacterium]